MRALAAAVLVCAMLGAGAAQAQQAPDLRGVSVNEGKERLRQAGYAPARNINRNGQQWDLWQRFGRNDGCVGFTSYRGTITDTNRFDVRECGGDVADNGPGRGDGPGRGNGGWGGPGRDGFDLRQLQGLYVNDGKERLRTGGFSFSRTLRRGSQQWDLWQSYGGRGECVGFTSYRGQISATDRFDIRDCGGDDTPSGGGRGFEQRSLMGLSVNDAKYRLEQGGFEHSHNIRRGAQQWDLWRQRGRGGQCVGFTSYRGTVSATDTFPRDCETD
jgi:hypothetical protein